MSEHVYINGERVNAAMPLRTLFYGEGVFETFRYKNKLPVFFDKHLSRMGRGASFLQIPFPTKEYIAGLVNKAVLESEIADAYVKICLLSNGQSAFYEAAVASQVLVIIRQYVPSNSFLRLTVNSFKTISKSPLRAVKSMNYLESILARREALGLGFDEALFLNEKEEIVECSTSNIFWFKDEILHTPSDECGCLPGTMRELILTIIDSCNIQVKQGRFMLKDLLAAESIFVTNSLIGCTPVSEVNGDFFGTDNGSLDVIKDILLQKLEWV